MVVWTHINSFRISFYSFFIFSLFEQPVALILYLLCFLKLWLSSRKTPLCVDYKSYVINHPFTQMQKWNKFFSSGLHNMRAACACASFLNCRKCCKKPTSDELLVQKLFQTTMTYILLWCAENLCWSIWSFELWVVQACFSLTIAIKNSKTNVVLLLAFLQVLRLQCLHVAGDLNFLLDQTFAKNYSPFVSKKLVYDFGIDSTCRHHTQQ